MNLNNQFRMYVDDDDNGDMNTIHYLRDLHIGLGLGADIWMDDYIPYSGNSSVDAGFFYCPYVPLVSSSALEKTLGAIEPIIKFKTRYGTLNL